MKVPTIARVRVGIHSRAAETRACDLGQAGRTPWGRTPWGWGWPRTERDAVEDDAGEGRAREETEEAVDGESGGEGGARPHDAHLQVAPGEQRPAAKPGQEKAVRWPS